MLSLEQLWFSHWRHAEEKAEIRHQRPRHRNAEADTANMASADPGLETEITSTDPITIRLAYDVAESHPSHKAFVEKFQNALQNASNGNITVELYPNSQLGSLAENMEAMRIGDLEMAALNEFLLRELYQSIIW